MLCSKKRDRIWEQGIAVEERHLQDSIAADLLAIVTIPVWVFIPQPALPCSTKPECMLS